MTVGEGPDLRFSLASERTLLAWVRSERAMRHSTPAAFTGLVGVAALGTRRARSPTRVTADVPVEAPDTGLVGAT